MRKSNMQIILRLMQLVRPLLPVMLLAVLAGVIGYLCAIFITIFGAWALLHTVGYNVPFSVSALIASMLVFALFRGILRYAEQAGNHYLAFKLLALIRDKVFKALRRLAPAKLETRDKGNLISVITTDIELLEVFYAHTISPVLIAIIVSVIMVVFLTGYHIALAMILLAGYIVVGVLIPLATSKAGKKQGDAFREKFGVLGSTVLCALRGLSEVLQYNSGEKQLAEIESQTLELNNEQQKLKNLEGWNAAFTNSAILVFTLLILFTSALLHMNGMIGFEGVVIVTVASMGSFGPVVALSSLANNLLQTFAAGNRVLSLLDEQPETEDIIDGVSPSFAGMSCDNISFGYSDETILEGFTMDIPQSGVIGITGKSGTGKSSLLRLLMRFWDTNKGSVSMSGYDVREISTKALRKTQSFVTQETHLFRDTIENNIKIANPKATRKQVEAACKKASIHEFIMTLQNGYETNVGELGDTLSGGERQRLGLARAFLYDSPMILLDEPTSNLDSLNEGIVLNSLVAETKNKSVVLVSHRASTMGIANHIFSMQGGRKS